MKSICLLAFDGYFRQVSVMLVVATTRQRAHTHFNRKSLTFFNERRS